MTLNIKRPVQEITLPGGSSVHVRHLTIAELRQIDSRVDAGPDDEHDIRAALMLCGYALAHADGSPLYPACTDADLADIEQLTTSQIETICKAAVPSKETAKN